jgi:8-oxo-dGTP pyrophosphatase MutT (NUDIX family)
MEKAGYPPMRPRDAATLIILRHDGPSPRFMMGKRHENSKFMPGKFVFPGGRVDPGDSRVIPANPLHPLVEKSLLNKMRGKPSRLRAQALAMAAIRETFEEVGLIIGKPHHGGFHTRSKHWKPFADTGHAPDLSNINFLARAITPPGRPRRFDARFFVVDASQVANIDSPCAVDTDELLECHWVSFDKVGKLDLPYITTRILGLLQESLASKDGLAPGHPVPFQRMSPAGWVWDTV